MGMGTGIGGHSPYKFHGYIDKNGRRKAWITSELEFAPAESLIEVKEEPEEKDLYSKFQCEMIGKNHRDSGRIQEAEFWEWVVARWPI